LEDGMIVAVVNLKGGVAKTTTAIAIATAAARAGAPARVLDADPQGSASLWAELAEAAGDALPFDVEPANVTTVNRLARVRPAAGEWAVIDCPPSGKVADAAIMACDFAIIPTTPSAIDLQQSYATAHTLEANDKPYALLVVRADRRTLSFRATQQAIAENGISCFDTTIPQREEIKGSFGRNFGDLGAYGDAYAELVEAMRDGD
jgi:chromosome partitioning protein